MFHGHSGDAVYAGAGGTTVTGAGGAAGTAGTAGAARRDPTEVRRRGRALMELF